MTRLLKEAELKLRRSDWEAELEQKLENAKRRRHLIDRRVGRIGDQLRELRSARSMREEQRFIHAAREMLGRDLYDAIWAKAREAL